MNIEKLTQITNGLLYYSESENPFTISGWGKLSTQDIKQHISKEAEGELHEIAADDFFMKMTRLADPSDTDMVANANKAKALQVYLKENLAHMQVYRVEGNAQIPIFIICVDRDGNCTTLRTLSIET
ncbi:MAG: hypothetical protein K0R59_74 [Sphingobacterium sp.]|jgi:hypothetical protein|nr:hypothetical protein [Sphingobacterium sp.]